MRSLLAVLAGFFLMAVVVMVSTPLLARLFIRKGENVGPNFIPMPYLVVNLAAGAIAAFLGGYLTASIARDHMLRHGGALAVFMVVMSVFSMRQSKGKQPVWYAVALATVMPVIAIAGAYVCALRA